MLYFEELRIKNKQRLAVFKNSKGEPAHSQEDGSDWSHLEWGGALAGEVGELLNLIKKCRRGDLDVTNSLVRRVIADEIGDVAAYLDLLATRLDLRLEDCIVDKFNKVSDRINSDIKLT